MPVITGVNADRFNATEIARILWDKEQLFNVTFADLKPSEKQMQIDDAQYLIDQLVAQGIAYT
jgi:hypothetical protein